MLLRFTVFSLLSVCALSLTCYDCFNTGPRHEGCTQARNCSGAACMIYDAGDNASVTAFCLLAMKKDEKVKKSNGCWLEPDGKGKHCICYTDFCNKLKDSREPWLTSQNDPLSVSIGGALFLKQNPLIDYEDDNDGLNAAPVPNNVLFPGAGMEDPKTAGADSDDDDLVAINFDEYDQQEKSGQLKEESNKHENDIGDPGTSTEKSTSASPCILLFLTMAASWARLFMGI